MDLTYNFMLPVLMFIWDKTHSYGWALVGLTLGVRAVLWPLVAKQTESMQKMSQIQPEMNKIKDVYKDDPEMQKQKLMEFYMKNQVNPLGGCLPILLQLPIFIALFTTFSGPPFGDKPIIVNVKVVKSAQAVKETQKETSDSTQPYVSPEGVKAKVAVYPGTVKLSTGESMDFGTRAIEGELGSAFKPKWQIFKGNKEVQPEAATISETGHAVFNQDGDYQVNALIPGVAKDESFGPFSGLGKIAVGEKLFDPKNFDVLALVIGFGISMWISQKFMMPQNKIDPAKMDDQQRVQQDTMKIMPVAMTVMFFFMPLPLGVLVYMFISNVIQSFQTWILMKRPVKPLVSVVDDVPAGPGGGGNGSGDSNSNGKAKKKKKKK